MHHKISNSVLVNLLPSEEKQGLAQKLRHAIQSVPANIAEGYGRYHYLDSLRFYSCARGALNKSLSYFITARALNYIDQSYFDALYHLARRAERALNGYMNYVRKQRTGADLYGTQCLRKEIVEYVIQEEVG